MKTESPVKQGVLRTYCVGLPVIIMVAQDGVVTYEIDTSEAGQAIREDELCSSPYTEAEQEQDARAVDQDHEARRLRAL